MKRFLPQFEPTSSGTPHVHHRSFENFESVTLMQVRSSHYPQETVRLSHLDRKTSVASGGRWPAQTWHANYQFLHRVVTLPEQSLSRIFRYSLLRTHCRQLFGPHDVSCRRELQSAHIFRGSHGRCCRVSCAPWGSLLPLTAKARCLADAI